MSSAESGRPESAGCPVKNTLGAPFTNTTLADPKILAHPNAFYKAVRTEDPVHYDPKLEMYLVSRYEDLQIVLRDPTLFSLKHGFSEMLAKGFQEEYQDILRRDGGGYFLNPFCDPPEHFRVRRLLESAFTAHRVKQLEPSITALTIDLIEKILGKGSAEIVSEFAIPMTSGIICRQLGVDVPSDTIQRWSTASTDQISRMNSREDMVRAAKDICEFQNFVIAQINDRRKNPKEDMITDLVLARAEGEANPTLAFEELVPLCLALLTAGNETTATALTNMFFFLATKPDIRKFLRDAADDDRLVGRFVEELLRIEPPVRGLTRMTTQEVELGGTKLPKGAHLLLLFASANDDEAEFGCPREFNVERSNLGRHLTFSGGIHRCVGAPLARMELKVAAREIIKRMDNFKLEIPVEDISYRPTVATWQMERMPLTFTRRA